MTSPFNQKPWTVLGLALLTASSVANAQEFGLDLTDSTDYRPRLAVIGLAAVDPAVPPDLGEKLKVDKVATEVVESAERSSTFSAVLPPADVYGKVSETYAEALACAEESCLIPLGDKLGVNQVVTGQLVLKNGKPLLRVLQFTRFINKLEVTEVPLDGGPRDFERKALAAFGAVFKKASATLAILKITGGPKGTTARVAQGLLGPVPMDQALPAGTYLLKIEAEGFLADEIELNLASGTTKKIEANLIPKSADGAPAPAPAAAVAVSTMPSGPSGKAMLKRPGLYVALAGAVVAAIGLSFGAAAQGIERRAVDADANGTLDITRAERQRAYTDATLANVLVGTGAAALAGGALWFFLTPRAPAHPVLSSPDESGLGMSLGVGGSLP